MKSKEKLEEPQAVTAKQPSACVICGKSATRNVDGDPSCEEHVELVYEDQVEKYTQKHLVHDEWLEKKS
jgi:hypothetical protein